MRHFGAHVSMKKKEEDWEDEDVEEGRDEDEE